MMLWEEAVHWAVDRAGYLSGGLCPSWLISLPLWLLWTVAGLFARPAAAADCAAPHCTTRAAAPPQEIRDWMDAPGNSDEFLLLYFDDQPNLQTWVGGAGWVEGWMAGWWLDGCSVWGLAGWVGVWVSGWVGARFARPTCTLGWVVDGGVGGARAAGKVSSVRSSEASAQSGRLACGGPLSGSQPVEVRVCAPSPPLHPSRSRLHCLCSYTHFQLCLPSPLSLSLPSPTTAGQAGPPPERHPGHLPSLLDIQR